MLGKNRWRRGNEGLNLSGKDKVDTRNGPVWQAFREGGLIPFGLHN
ncbi:MAG: hypothetical protein KTR30_24895 [Saprospiraceae bacterium]|nr:hypothetical protein [Saprospiraceae bacterium]